jgi:hypothetical protein
MLPSLIGVGVLVQSDRYPYLKQTIGITVIVLFLLKYFQLTASFNVIFKIRLP